MDNSLSADDARSLAIFVTEMVRLEQMIDLVLIDRYAHPERQDLFERRFLRHLTIDRKLEHLRPFKLELREAHGGNGLIAEINELVKVRNQVVQRLPSVNLVKLFGFGFISDAVTNRADINRSHEWRDRDDKVVVTATDLDHCTMRANEAASSVQRLIKPGV